MRTLKLLSMLCLLWTVGIVANAEEIPNDEIWYEASEKLTETIFQYDPGLHINAFNTSISSHTFSNGKGLIKFNGNVTSIGDWAFNGCSELTSVTIPNSVTSIGDGAFYWCSGLTSVTMGNSVTNIGDEAFWDCLYLKSISIPNSVTSIGVDAFHSCRSLPVEGNLRYADTYLVEVVDKTQSTYTIKEGTKWIGGSAFSGCSSLTSISIPNSVTSIGNDAFYGCTSLPVENNLRYADTYLVSAVDKTQSTYTIKEGTKWIGSDAFSKCKSLTSITIPNSVTSIEEEAFYWCSGLTSITIPNSVTSIGEHAFTSCVSLKSITIPNSVTSIESSAFSSCFRLTSITIPNSVTSIGDWAFSGCSSLTSITIPNSVTSIGSGAFGGCSGLTSVSVNVGNIKYDSRNNCNAIIETSTNMLIMGYKNTIIPNSVTSIGEYAFYRCSGLTSVTIPNSVTSIGAHAFSGCEGLTSITIPNSVTSIGDDAFYDCTSLSVENNLRYADTYLVGAVDKTQSTYTIKEGTKWIGSSAFYGCTSLTSITIPNSVTSIEEEAFFGCSGLTSITIPNSVTSIGWNAFSDCKGLTSITITNSVTSIGEYAFYRCEGLTSVTIPNSVTSIGAHAFDGCEGLTSVTIPISVTSIGNYAFSDCSGLTSMYVYWNEPLVVPWGMLSGSSINSATLYVPAGTKALYEAASVWKEFGTIEENSQNFIATDKSGAKINKEVTANDDVEIQDSYVDLLITENIDDVNITYTRSFSSSGNWQAWFVPFDVNYNDMSKDYEVAQIQGVLTDENGSPYIAFCKVKSGVIKANTPYVVKPKLSGEIQTKTTSKLHTTDDAKPFTIQSVANTFTFGGVYEKTTIGNKGWYALNTKGSFQKMGESLYLKSFRLYMSIAERADNPYSASVASDEVKMIVLGDEDATSINEVESLISTGKMYTIQGLETNVIRRGEIYIINGKKYLGK